MSENLKHLEESNFHSQVANGVVLVDFYADWCGPCKAIAPVVAELADEMNGKATVAKVNVDNAQGIAGEFNVSSIPTLILFKNGQEVKRVVGIKDKNSLRDMIQAAL
jgi:thioredoxin 1